MLPSVVIRPSGVRRLGEGHPWIFRDDILEGPATDARTQGPLLVSVLDGRRKPLGLATWASSARLALRIWSRGEGAVRETRPFLALVEERLTQALSRRAALGLDRDALRLVHGEADDIPGLIVDRYADAVVLQTTSVAMNAVRDDLALLLARKTGARIVVARDDGSARDFEELPRNKAVLWRDPTWDGPAAMGDASVEILYRLGANRLAADLLNDAKTGGFLDQADNHAAVAAEVRALGRSNVRALDAFTYHGGFALALARVSSQVLAYDEAPEAAARARANAARNELPHLIVERANAFDRLRALEAAGEQFDAVVIDPPALAKRGQGEAARAAADRAYHELFLRGARLTRPGGIFVPCSCSGRVSREAFEGLVAHAVADAGRTAQIVARRGASADHPERVGVPETGHLKCWILRVL
jgi:23S rRNA (cytosine1962-C5)-methyltransferase